MGTSQIGQAVGQAADRLGGQAVGDRRLVETGQTVEVDQTVEVGQAGGGRPGGGDRLGGWR